MSTQSVYEISATTVDITLAAKYIEMVRVWSDRKNERIIALVSAGKFSEEKCVEVATAVQIVLNHVEQLATNDPKALIVEMDDVTREDDCFILFDNKMKVEGAKLQKQIA